MAMSFFLIQLLHCCLKAASLHFPLLRILGSPTDQRLAGVRFHPYRFPFKQVLGVYKNAGAQ